MGRNKKRICEWVENNRTIDHYIEAKREAFLKQFNDWCDSTDHEDWYFQEIAENEQEFVFPNYNNWVVSEIQSHEGEMADQAYEQYKDERI